MVSKRRSLIRKAPILGLVIVAVFAFTAVVASAAQGSEFEWESGTTKLGRISNGVQKFLIPSLGSFECNQLLAEAAVSGTKASSFTTTKGTLHYQHDGIADSCPASIGTAHIATNECQYQFVAGASTGIGKSEGSMNILCPFGKAIEWNVSGWCTVKFLPQINVGQVTYSTEAVTPSTVSIALHLKYVPYSQSGGCGTVTGKYAEFTGTITVAGTNAFGSKTAVKVSP
jgi:hypothetical protein